MIRSYIDAIHIETMGASVGDAPAVGDLSDAEMEEVPVSED